MAADVSGLRAKAQLRYARLAIESARALESELKIEAPHRSYELRESIEGRSYHTGPGLFTIVVESDKVQAATTNSGARPHKIRARRAKTLAFHWPKVGKVIFPVEVNHPGNAGTHWWDHVIDRRLLIFARVLRRL